MNILHTVESYHPSIGGMQEVVKQISERLVRLGHRVTVATRFHPERKDKVLQGVHLEQFEISGNAVNGYTSGSDEIKRYQQLLTNSSFDIVTNFAAQQWATDLALPLLSRINARKVFVPTGFSGLYLPQYKTYFHKMKSWMKGFDANVFLSDNYRDIQFARDNGITRNRCIPNGAAADEFLPESRIDIRARLGCNRDACMVLHVGSYTGLKGHREALEVFLKAEVPNGVLVMIGNGNEQFRSDLRLQPGLSLLRWMKRKKVIIASLSRQETVAAYKSADIFLFPSNIECSPIVLFECMASRLPFLTTDVGNAAEIIQWSGGGQLLPTSKNGNGYGRADIRGSVAILNRLASDAAQRKQLGEAGFDAWRKNFSWETIAKKYEELYAILITSGTLTV